MTVTQAMVRLGIPASDIRALIHAGKLQASKDKPGSPYKLDLVSVLRYEKQLRARRPSEAVEAKPERPRKPRNDFHLLAAKARELEAAARNLAYQCQRAADRVMEKKLDKG